ncbi:Cg30 protein [Alphabaculovirus altersperidaniae]|uniref:Cg30 protein n=1 Tax=Spodoptera eridania nucleopolyhedrovirus TaxID=2315721 RepID=A0ABX6TPY0_9ABAC|nr:Cg30 protein [Spodoptera eridania nucleopolyhedrovirus]QNV47814.1 Cg30 protein [Spodoptera eridania nucleopolyhedrovirus]
MESLVLTCPVCFCETTLKKPSVEDGTLFVMPLFKLSECRHAFCLMCCKSIQDGRKRAITCPTCRTPSEKIFSQFYGNNKWVSFELTLNSIIKNGDTTSSFLEYINRVYGSNIINQSAAEPSTSAGPSTSAARFSTFISDEPSTSTFAGPPLDLDDDLDRQRLEAVFELSRVQYEQEKIQKTINDNLDNELKAEALRKTIRDLEVVVKEKNKQMNEAFATTIFLIKMEKDLKKDIAEKQMILDKDAEIKARLKLSVGGPTIKENDDKKITIYDPEIAQMSVDIKKKIEEKKNKMSSEQLKKIYGCCCKTYEHDAKCVNVSESVRSIWLKKRKLSECNAIFKDFLNFKKTTQFVKIFKKQRNL